MAVLAARPINLMTRSMHRLPLSLLAMTALIAATWYRTLLDMWGRWYPAWQQTHRPFMDRLIEGHSYYAHGPLAVIASMAVAWSIHRRIGCPIQRKRSSSVVGGVLLIGTLSIHLLSLWSQITFTSGCALIGVMMALLLLTGGWSLARAYFAPVMLLIFMVPLPMIWISQLNFDLKIAMAHWAATWVEAITHITTEIDGSALLIHLPDATWHTLRIEDSCSGLRNLVALSWFAALFAVVCQLPTIGRWAILAMAIPVALIVNVVRIFLLIVLTHDLGMEAVAEDTAAHQWIAIGVFVVALLMFILIERVVLFVKFHCPTNVSVGVPPMIHRSHDNRLHPPLSRWAWVVMIATASVTVGLHRLNHRPTPIIWRASSINSLFWLGSEAFRGYDLGLTDRFKGLLGTEHILHRRYINRSGTSQADLLLVHDNAGRRSIHPPEVCLEAIGARTVAEQDVSVSMPDGRCIVMRQMITQHGLLKFCHLYVYRCDAGYTVSFFDQQMKSVLNRLRRGHSNNSLVRISVPDLHRNMSITRRLAAQIAQQLLPQVEQIIDGECVIAEGHGVAKTSSDQIQPVVHKG